MSARNCACVTAFWSSSRAGFHSCWSAPCPFCYLMQPEISYVDAVFESMSGLTTTGATILTNIDELPRGILYYRQQLQWLGGLGIVVLAVAIMPMLRIGGMQLYRAETPGPLKDSKLTPRITETAKALWLIYLGITVLCALAYWLGGMTLFDAVGHAFSTVAIGGMSTHDAGFTTSTARPLKSSRHSSWWLPESILRSTSPPGNAPVRSPIFKTLNSRSTHRYCSASRSDHHRTVSERHLWFDC